MDKTNPELNTIVFDCLTTVGKVVEINHCRDNRFSVLVEHRS
jgi:hypothetical protein